MATDRLSTVPRSSRRGAFRLLGGGLALLAGGAPCIADARARKPDRKDDRKKERRRKPKFRTVTRTFSNASPIAILPGDIPNPANPYPSAIQVTGFKQGKLLDVNVTLKDLSDTFPRTLDVQLQAPSGRRATIMSDVGDAFNLSAVNLILDDQAAAVLPESSRIGSGRFKPTNVNPAGDAGDNFPSPAPAGTTDNVKLATFTGINPNGTWRLFVVRDGGGEGSLDAGWSLTIKARVRL